MQLISDIIKSYGEIDEEHRLQSTLARKVEFISTIETIKSYYIEKMKILDLGCGTGIYSLHLAEMGAEVVSVDLVPKHIERLRQLAHKKNISLKSLVGNASDLKRFDNEYFDMILCLGPLYHIVEAKERSQCVDECIRVVKKEGIIAFSYISPYSVFPCVIRGDISRVSKKLFNKILDERIIESEDKCCFWTDNCYFLPDEITHFLKEKGLLIEDHLATDGQSIAFQSVINAMNDDEFLIWLEYHRKVCRSEYIIGTSNHCLVIARKKK